ncbi:MAG TPA: HAMP domain-containing sensor histidine kinase [Acetivibrio sp.]|nr:HAMP domain-containing sensor histidine kinase [Acetivibrio sp.]
MNIKPDVHTRLKIIVFLLIATIAIVNVGSFLLFSISNDKALTYSKPVLGFPMMQNICHAIIEICLGIIAVIAIYENRNIRKKNRLQIEKLIKQLEKELNEKNELMENIKSHYDKALKLINQRSEFFYNISHELKTPLSVILGAIQLIDQKYPLEGSDRRKSSKHLCTIKQNCYRLLRLINNVLDISRLENGYIKTNLVNCNIVYLTEEITESVIPFVEQKGLSIEFDTLDEEIITAVDIDKIERIILNLLSNAIKFTNPGGMIYVKVARKDNNVVIHIIDTGIGIPRDMQSKIFDRYSQVSSELTAEFEGSGIGLSIVKSFVELHNGSIEVQSEENHGSKFTITLPIMVCDKHYNADQVQNNTQNRIIETVRIEFSDIYTMPT